MAAVSGKSEAERALSRRLAELRTMAGISQSELARRLGAYPTQVSKWEDPEKSVPTVKILVRYPEALGIDPVQHPGVLGWLLTGFGSPEGIISPAPVEFTPGVSAALTSIESRLEVLEAAGVEEPVQEAYVQTEALMRRRRDARISVPGEWAEWKLIRQSAIVSGYYDPLPEPEADEKDGVADGNGMAS